jgi:hypothetical protein
MSLLLNTNKENFNVKSRDISKGLIKRTVCGMLQYPASAYQINVKKITVMILKKGKFLLTDKSSNLFNRCNYNFNCL